MRALAALVVAGLFGPAAADNESREPVPVPKRSVTLAFGGHAGRLAGLAEGGVDVGLEYALGHRRWQYFGEGTVSGVHVGPQAQRIGGLRLRGGLGIRWLARSFVIDEVAAVEMNLEAFSGVQQFHWTDGGRLTRPDLGIGMGWQVRVFRRELIVRISMRAVFAPADRDIMMPACHGVCTSASGSNTGFAAGLGIAW